MARSSCVASTDLPFAIQMNGNQIKVNIFLYNLQHFITYQMLCTPKYSQEEQSME